MSLATRLEQQARQRTALLGKRRRFLRNRKVHGGGAPEPKFPDATNTGIPPGTVLTPFSGIFQSTAPNQIIDSLDIQGELIINHPGVTVKRTVVRGETLHLCRINIGADQFRMEDCRIDGMGNTINAIALFGTQDVVIIRCDVSRAQNCITVGMNNTLVQDCYIHDLIDAHSDPHYDGVDNGGGANFMTVRHCTIKHFNAQTSCVSMFQDFGVPHDNLVENCYLAGGGYCIYGGGGGLGTPSNIVIRNNVFGKDYYPTGGFFGPVAAWVPSGPGNTWTGNTWSDGSGPVLP